MPWYSLSRIGKRPCPAHPPFLSPPVSTKILPEAASWHFAGTWSHMPALVAAHGGDLGAAFPRSRQLLERAVSLPVMVNMAEALPQAIRTALAEALSPVPKTLAQGIVA